MPRVTLYGSPYSQGNNKFQARFDWLEARTMDWSIRLEVIDGTTWAAHYSIDDPDIALMFKLTFGGT